MIQSIVSKIKVEPSKKTAHYKHRLPKPIAKCGRKSLPVFTGMNVEDLEMDFDQRINERAFFHEEQTSALKEKIKQVKNKFNQKDNL